MCSVLIKFLVTMFINLIFKYVYLEIGPIILDLLITINCPYHENVYESTPWILIPINKRKKMKSHSVCIHNLFYEKQLNLALVINAKWLYHIQSFRKKARWGWLNHEPKHWGWVSVNWLTLPVLFSESASWKHTKVNLSELNLSHMKVTS